MRCVMAPGLELDLRMPAALQSQPLVLAAVPVQDCLAQLLPQEQDALGDALPKRTREFSSGRHAAHLAMAAMELQVQPVTLGEGRAPIWPQGLVGSITHTRDLAMALLAATAQMRGLGVDLEEAEAVTRDLFSALYTSQELTWIDDRRLATLVFCAKEAIYKSIFPLAGQFIDFPEVEISLDSLVLPTRFSARYLGDHAPSRQLMAGQGYILSLPGHVLCVYLLPQLQ